ncbi:hypothetical protein [Colwellia psychrerythraea]|uniref:Lipoprotein n=1 Tax=Colwellia psychrerythraea TaxID=28229 RepID=A0A099KW42_COLPS|nr:hypothetical protein [Colwellia psychrerythraea]KGJ93873.1 hypothetical protein GAB14E_2428 [Colwellia psychrerythraea]
MTKLITAVLLTTALSFNVLANEQCGEEDKNIIAMQERNLHHGALKTSSFLAYTRITVGSAGMVYAVVNSATGIGLLSFVVFLGGALDIYINSENDEVIEKLTEKLCT